MVGGGKAVEPLGSQRRRRQEQQNGAGERQHGHQAREDDNFSV